jgi:hypothetical protein
MDQVQSQMVVKKNKKTMQICEKDIKTSYISPKMAFHHSLAIFDPRKIMQFLKMNP